MRPPEKDCVSLGGSLLFFPVFSASACQLIRCRYSLACPPHRHQPTRPPIYYILDKAHHLIHNADMANARSLFDIPPYDSTTQQHINGYAMPFYQAQAQHESAHVMDTIFSRQSDDHNLCARACVAVGV